MPGGCSGISSSNSITVSFANNYNGGFICVTPVNDCGNGISNCKNVPVLAIKPANPGFITGPALACGPATYTYAIPAVANALSYVWNVSGTGVTLLSGQGTNSVQVSVPAGFGQGTINVYASNCIGISSTRQLSITGTPTHSNALVGPGFVCPGTSGVTYSMGSVNGTASYNWSISGNANIASTSNNSCVVNFSPTWTSGVLTVTTVNACGSFSRAYTIHSAPAQPGSITGPNSAVCGMTNVTYSIVAIAGATGYSWTIPAGVTALTPLTGSTSISVNFAAFTGTGNICVSATNACGAGVARCYSITARPAAAGIITGPASVCKSSTQQYSIATIQGANTYSWSVTGGPSMIPTGTSATLNFNYSLSASATLKVNGNNACGPGQPAQKTIAINAGCRTVEQDAINSESLSAYPNPTKGILTVSFNSEAKARYIAKVVDLLGNVVFMEIIDAVEGKNIFEIDLSQSATGLYMFSLDNGNGSTQSIRVAVD